MKKILMVVLVLMLMVSISSTCFAGDIGSGSLDSYKGHYIQSNHNTVLAYQYFDGMYKGWSVTFKCVVQWDKRSTLDKYKPFIPKTNVKDVYCADSWKYTQPIPTVIPTKSTVPTATATATATQVTTSPTKTVIETAQPTKTGSFETTSHETDNTTDISHNPNQDLPKTGENSNTGLLILGIVVIVCGVCSIKFLR